MTTGWLVLARVAHVLGVVVWIGGVGFVTTVLIPAIRSMDDPVRRADLFERLEGRFAWIARLATIVVGATGFIMISALDLWGRFYNFAYWWMHAMVSIWAIFVLLLFLVEPLVLRRRLATRMREKPEATFVFMQRAHWALLIASLATIAGAIAGSHGYLFFASGN